MSCNVLIGVPKGCPIHVTQGLENCIKSVLRSVEEVKVVFDSLEYIKEIQSEDKNYRVTIAVDALGKDSVYVPYLQGIQKVNPQLRIIVVVPNERKGSRSMEDLVDMGLFNALYQQDLNGDNLYKLITEPREILDAAEYYGIDLIARADQRMMVRYGYPRSDEKRPITKEQGPVTRKVRDKVYATRGIAKDFVNADELAAEDDKLFAFLDKEGYDLDNINTGRTRRMDFVLDPEWVDAYKQDVNKFFRDRGLADLQAFENGSCSEEDFRKLLYRRLRDLRIPVEKQDAVAESFMKDIVSYGKLDVVLNTVGISDVKLNNKDSITVQYKGEWFDTNIKFGSDAEFSYFINKICTKNHVAVNINSTQVIFSDIKTSKDARYRISVSHKSINTSGLTTASIRKIDRKKKMAHELVAEGYWTLEQAALLKSYMEAEKSIIFCGASGSGKTVGLNCLLEYLPDNITGVCMQEAEELFADSKVNLEFQHSIAAKGEGKVKVALKDLATQGLVKNADVFIIGEIKGNEASDFFGAINNGAQCLCTTHANTAFDALERIADLARDAGYSQEQMLKMLAEHVDIVVNMHKYKVRSIVGVVGWDSERKEVVYDVYKFEE